MCHAWCLLAPKYTVLPGDLRVLLFVTILLPLAELPRYFCQLDFYRLDIDAVTLSYIVWLRGFGDKASLQCSWSVDSGDWSSTVARHGISPPPLFKVQYPYIVILEGGF